MQPDTDPDPQPPTTTASASDPPKNSLPPWQKLLYGNAGYPDNYTDITVFLKDLETNKHVRHFSHTEAVCGAARLNHQLSVCTLFLSVFHRMYVDRLRPELALTYSALATGLAYICYMLLAERPVAAATFIHPAAGPVSGVREHAKTVLTVLGFGFFLAPMMHTLTDSISTDTIFTLTLFVFLVHLVFFDWGLPAFMSSQAISVNAALFGSVCLASRLPSVLHAFALLCVATEFFVLFPRLVQAFWHPALVLPMMGVCAMALHEHRVMFGLYAFACVVVNVVCPVLFVRMQANKKTIHGPWDEAIIKDSDMNVQLALQAHRDRAGKKQD